jgi:acetate---CoA ligase (ADP-forming)
MSEIQKCFQALFHPRSVAFIGATDKPMKWGSIILNNMKLGGFPGTIYPVNPTESEVQGLRSYPRVTDLPETPDLAVIVVPPAAVPSVVDDCVARGVRAGLVITAGFAEVGADGMRLQEEMVQKARRGNMILVGPNCNGIMRPPERFYVAMPPVFPPPGSMAVVAQSGNVATSIVRRVMKRGMGCSCFVSSGNEADLHGEDYLTFLADDPETKVILHYIEGFRDGERFLEIASQVTKKKPVIVLKGGSTAAGAQAAHSHTASLAGSDRVFDGVCSQAGIIRAENMDEMVDIAVSLTKQPLPQGRRVGIVTAGGGWGVLAADACSRCGLDVVPLSAETIAELDSFLPAWWNRGNPVDLVAGLKKDDLGRSLEVLLKSPEVDGVILLGITSAIVFDPLPPVLTPEVVAQRIEAMTKRIGDLYDRFMELAVHYRKPVIIASEFPFSMGNLEERLVQTLGAKGYVCYPSPQTSALVMMHLCRYADYLRKK